MHGGISRVEYLLRPVSGPRLPSERTATPPSILYSEIRFICPRADLVIIVLLTTQSVIAARAPSWTGRSRSEHTNEMGRCRIEIERERDSQTLARRRDDGVRHLEAPRLTQRTDGVTDGLGIAQQTRSTAPRGTPTRHSDSVVRERTRLVRSRFSHDPWPSLGSQRD